MLSELKPTFLRPFFALVIIFNLCFLPVDAQQDTVRSEPDFHQVDINSLPSGQLTEYDRGGRPWIARNPYRGLVAPAILIGLGAGILAGPSYNQDAKDLLNQGFHNFGGTEIDDYLIYAPYAGLVALNLVKIPCENDFINTAIIIAKAEVVNAALTFGLKYLTKVERPNGENSYSWPSGHTSQAFLAATIANREYRYKTPWVGIGAYGAAGTVALFRMLNNKHWLSDVVAGAGIGILSANLVYMTHQWRWGRPGSCLVPSLINGRPGAVLVYRF